MRTPFRQRRGSVFLTGMVSIGGRAATPTTDRPVGQACVSLWWHRSPSVAVGASGQAGGRRTGGPICLLSQARDSLPPWWCRLMAFAALARASIGPGRATGPCEGLVAAFICWARGRARLFARIGMISRCQSLAGVDHSIGYQLVWAGPFLRCLRAPTGDIPECQCEALRRQGAVVPVVHFWGLRAREAIAQHATGRGSPRTRHSRGALAGGYTPRRLLSFPSGQRITRVRCGAPTGGRVTG